MKKIVFSTLILLSALTLLLSLTACQDPQPPADDASFDAQYSRSGYPEQLGPLAVTVIRTRWELDCYLDTFPYPDATWNNEPTLTQIFERYDENYFVSRDLIIAFVEEGSGSVRTRSIRSAAMIRRDSGRSILSDSFRK